MLEMPLPTFLHMPMGFDVYIGRAHQVIQQLGMQEKWPGLYLTSTGWFKGKILAPLVDGKSPSRHVIHLPRPFEFYVRLHHGGIGTMKSTLKEMQAELFDAGRMPKEMFMAHLTCPNCAEERGGEKILMFRRWEHSPTLARRMKNRE